MSGQCERITASESLVEGGGINVEVSKHDCFIEESKRCFIGESKRCFIEESKRK